MYLRIESDHYPVFEFFRPSHINDALLGIVLKLCGLRLLVSVPNLREFVVTHSAEQVLGLLNNWMPAYGIHVALVIKFVRHLVGFPQVKH